MLAAPFVRKSSSTLKEAILPCVDRNGKMEELELTETVAQLFSWSHYDSEALPTEFEVRGSSKISLLILPRQPNHLCVVSKWTRAVSCQQCQSSWEGNLVAGVGFHGLELGWIHSDCDKDLQDTKQKHPGSPLWSISISNMHKNSS